jgi:hypothetical protein
MSKVVRTAAASSITHQMSRWCPANCRSLSSPASRMVLTFMVKKVGASSAAKDYAQCVSHASQAGAARLRPYLCSFKPSAPRRWRRSRQTWCNAPASRS